MLVAVEGMPAKCTEAPISSNVILHPAGPEMQSLEPLYLKHLPKEIRQEKSKLVVK